MNDPDPGYVYVPTSAHGTAKYHTKGCRYVRTTHTQKPVLWAERSRLEECSICTGTGQTNKGGTIVSPANQIKMAHRQGRL